MKNQVRIVMKTGRSPQPMVRLKKEEQAVGELQYVIDEFLTLLSELKQSQSSYNVSILESLLHLMTDLETQLAIVQTIIESECMIHNDLRVVQKNTVGEEP